MNSPRPTRLTGLSSTEAAARLAREGYNDLSSTTRSSLWTLVRSVLGEPMILLLLACGVIYLILGDAREASLLLASIGVVIGIDLYQEHKTERALEALHELSSPRALVIRDGQPHRIPGREVVRGDVMWLEEGDRVPADGLVRASTNVLVDESLLTGESVAVRKAASEQAQQLDPPGGDDLPSVFAGTLVVQGHGIAEVLRIGVSTELGAIGKALQMLRPEETTLQREIRRIVRIFATVGLSLCVVVAVLYAATRGSWVQGLLTGLTLAISMVPEEFPVVLTVFLALGAWRLSRHRVLTRRVPVVEMLGSATVLCADKTGTLTLNRMAVQQLVADGRTESIDATSTQPLPESYHELVASSILASSDTPRDPMEQAIRRLAQRLPRAPLCPDWSVVREYPFSKSWLAVAYVRRSPDGRMLHAAAKGAPETMTELCRLDAEQRSRVVVIANDMAAQGLRVLGVARATFPDGPIPDEPHQMRFAWVGLVGLADPLRPAVPQAMRICQAAGIRVVMMTGDYPATAQSIARQLGFPSSAAVITGPELGAMDDATLKRRVAHVNLFARIVPEQKLRLVNALKANGEIVAMTGDGVNDAPALKAAHIGIAMGERGTDVAREAAALVLLDDDFSSIVEAVALGRRIFENLQKAMAYVFAVHVPIAGLALIPVLFRWPLILWPVHIVFLELIIDPACSVAFEAEEAEADVMMRPPRPATQPMLNRRIVLLSVLQGLSVLAIVVAVYGLARFQGHGEAETRALTFTTLVIANLALIFTNRSWSRTILASWRSPNPSLWRVVGATVAVLMAVLSIPALRAVFRFDTLHLDDVGLCVAAGLVSILWFEALKAVSGWRRRAASLSGGSR